MHKGTTLEPLSCRSPKNAVTPELYRGSCAEGPRPSSRWASWARPGRVAAVFALDTGRADFLWFCEVVASQDLCYVAVVDLVQFNGTECAA